MLLGSAFYVPVPGVMALSEAGGYTPTALPGVEDWSPVIQAVTSKWTIAQIIGVLAAVVAAGLAFAFLWWAVRLAFSSIMGAVKKGTLSINSKSKRRRGG